MKLFLLLAAIVIVIITTTSITFTQALRFAIIGDWGMGGKTGPWQTEIRSAQAANLACAELDGGFCNFTISCGDNLYTPDVNFGFRESFSLFEKDRMGPFFPVSGNHDNMGPQLEFAKKNKRWKWPRPFYDFVVPIDDHGKSGHTVHFFALNSMDGGLGGGAQYQWLEKQLATSTSRWKILFAHFPIAGAGRHRREGTVGRIGPLMDKYNCQVFFSGHDHILDINNMMGRVLPISGAMSRGGMMLRALGGPFHQFTLTAPGEFNHWAQDWPLHGLFTAEISLNVMTLYAYDNGGGIMYNFHLTHDWIVKVRNKDTPKSLENKFPPFDFVKKALKEERTLPRGPGGGKFYSLDGDESDAPVYKDGVTEPAPTAVTPFKDQITTSTAAVNEHFHPHQNQINGGIPTTTLSSSDKDWQRMHEIVTKYVTFTVSSECFNCDRKIYAATPFSIFILGLDLSGKTRVFLTESKAGCALARNFPHFAPGTNVIQPMGNQAIFNVTSASTAFVCLSVDSGKNFDIITREDDVNHDKQFVILPVGQKPQGGGNTNNNQNNNQNANQNSNTNTNSNINQNNNNQQQQTTLPPSNQLSGGGLIVIVGFSLLVGAGVAILTKSDILASFTNSTVSSSSSSTSNQDTSAVTSTGGAPNTSSSASPSRTNNNSNHVRSNVDD